MARTNSLNNFLTDIAEAVRQKGATSSLITANQLDTAIKNIDLGFLPTTGTVEIITAGEDILEGAFVYIGEDKNIYMVNNIEQEISGISLATISQGQEGQIYTTSNKTTKRLPLIVTMPSSTYYTFTENGEEQEGQLVYQNNNSKVSSSYAIARVAFSNLSGATLHVMAMAQGESGCDYGEISSSLDSQLQRSTSTNYGKRISDTISEYTEIQTYTVPDDGFHWFEIKYRKDGSVDTGWDGIKFYVTAD